MLFSLSSDSPFRTVGLYSALKFTSLSLSTSVALTYFPPDRLRLFFWSDVSLFGVFWKVASVDINFWCKILLSRVYIVCLVPSLSLVSSSLKFRFKDFFLNFLLQNLYGYLKISQTGFTGFFFCDLAAEQQGTFVFLNITICSVTSQFLFQPTYTGTVLVSLKLLISCGWIENFCCLWLL